MSDSGTAMLNRIGVICKRLEQNFSRLPGILNLRRGAATEDAGVASTSLAFGGVVRSKLRSPGRLLVSLLMGLTGLAAAASIATFASRAEGVSGAVEQAAMLSQPGEARANNRSSWLTVALDTSLSERYFSHLLSLVVGMDEIESNGARKTVYLLDQPRNADVQIRLAAGTENAENVLYTRFLAPVVPFATLDDDVSMAELKLRWQGRGEGPLVIASDYVSELEAIFGEEAAASVQTASSSALAAVLEVSDGAMGIVPFENLTPVLKVLHLNGVNVLGNTFNPDTYPLKVVVAVFGADSESIAQELRPQITQPTNRRPEQLTTLIMTGVTAMARVTASRMDTKGYDYPSLVIAPTLRAADITHISNEVPFLEDCEANPSLNNMILCSKPAYWMALEALGTDIVGLSGNHINDFGRDGARESIGWYRQNGIPIYGGGLNEEEACTPLLRTHNGNRFAFIAALANHPSFAWATEDLPGACYYHTNRERILADIAALRGEVDVIAVELQHEENYNPAPLSQQVQDFRELRAAGVDIVTGVQSHVPQAMEPYGYAGNKPGTIVYGLGNLFFDQMWSWQTRTTLIARHTIHEGRVISTEILTAVLEDYAQPRWTTETERRDILRQIFQAAPAR